MTAYRDRIPLGPGKPGDKPCIRGLHITVQDVPTWLAEGRSTPDILVNFPKLHVEDVQVALAYAADRKRHFAWIQAE